MRKEKLCLDAVENAYVAVNAELTAMKELQQMSKLLDRLLLEEKPAADLEEARTMVNNARAKVDEARARAMIAEAIYLPCSHLAGWDGVLMDPPIRMEAARAAAEAEAAAEMRAAEEAAKAAEAEAEAEVERFAAERAEAERAEAGMVAAAEAERFAVERAAEAKAAAEAAAAAAEKADAEAEEEDRQRYEPRVVEAYKEARRLMRLAEAKDAELRLNPDSIYEEFADAVAKWDAAIAAYNKAKKLHSIWTRVSGAISRLISRGQRSRGAAVGEVAARDVAAIGSSRAISQPETRPVNTGWRLPRLSLFSRPRTGGMATRKKNRRYKKKKTKHYKKKTKRYTKKRNIRY